MCKRFVISEETKQRCKIFEIEPSNMSDYRVVSLENFGYLKEVNHIEFSIFFRFDQTMIEYITPDGFKHELVDNIIASLRKKYDNLDVCIRKEAYPEFMAILDKVRNKKIYNLLRKDPNLDQQTLKLFGSLASASQLMVKGGIDKEAARVAENATSIVIDNLMDSDIVIGTLTRMIHADPTLYDHSASVAMIAGVIAKKLLHKNEDESKLIALAGLCHDVGKTVIPSHILHKPGSFTQEEFAIMKTHTTSGYEELMKAIKMGAPLNKVVARVAGEHHEKFQGNGYPYNKYGRLEEHEDGIHEYTRIVTVADVFSALLMVRTYKRAYRPKEALRIMRKTAEKSYDPVIFEAFEASVIRTIEAHKSIEDKDKGRIIDIDQPSTPKKKSS